MADGGSEMFVQSIQKTPKTPQNPAAFFSVTFLPLSPVPILKKRGDGIVKRFGTVFIVGAGPGNPDLITVRGLTCLREADVVLHDRLVDRRLLEEARADAELINVGKEPGHEDIQQERIEWLMVEKARKGKTVCRLKGGDPFVFGRGAEEAR